MDYWKSVLADPDHIVGVVIPYPTEKRPLLIPGLLALVGVDQYNRLWKQDDKGITMVADLRKLPWV